LIYGAALADEKFDVFDENMQRIFKTIERVSKRVKIKHAP